MAVAWVSPVSAGASRAKDPSSRESRASFSLRASAFRRDTAPSRRKRSRRNLHCRRKGVVSLSGKGPERASRSPVAPTNPVYDSRRQALSVGAPCRVAAARRISRRFAAAAEIDGQGGRRALGEASTRASPVIRQAEGTAQRNRRSTQAGWPQRLCSSRLISNALNVDSPIRPPNARSPCPAGSSRSFCARRRRNRASALSGAVTHPVRTARSRNPDWQAVSRCIQLCSSQARLAWA